MPKLHIQYNIATFERRDLLMFNAVALHAYHARHVLSEGRRGSSQI
jgi:hypothetical protein